MERSGRACLEKLPSKVGLDNGAKTCWRCWRWWTARSRSSTRPSGGSQPATGARLLMTQPAVGPVTALAFVVTIGDVRRFKRGKQVGSYLGLIPAERSSATSAGWERFPNRVMYFCAHYWSKPRNLHAAMMSSFEKSINIAATRSPREWPRWRRHASWP